MFSESFRSYFWRKVAAPDSNGCMLWTGAMMAGYGTITIGGRRMYTHRVAWELANGPISAGLVVRHAVCGVPMCCNPAHLLPGTQAENVNDTKRMGRQRTPRGERSPHAKVTESDVMHMRQRAANGETSASIAVDYGIGTGNTHNIISGVSWSHLPTVDGRRRRNKLSDDDVMFVRDWVGAGWTHASVAKSLKVSVSLVTMIANGRRHAATI